jgi:hypothetical protein
MCSTHASALAAVRGAADQCRAPWTDLISPDELEVYRRAGYQTTYGLGTRPALSRSEMIVVVASLWACG